MDLSISVRGEVHMTIQNFSLGKKYSAFSEIISRIDTETGPLHIKGCAGSSSVFLICDIFSQVSKTVLVLVPDSKGADTLARECASLVGDDKVSLFLSRDAIPYNMKSPFGPTVESRFRVLSQLLNGEKRIIIASSAALIQKILPPKNLFSKIIKLSLNDRINLETLSSWLTGIGFIRETIVQDIGSFAIRGGIFDIYPFLTENPVRLEFWGDTIESIREFDVFKQNSKKMLSSVDIFPMKEFCITDPDVDNALVEIERYCYKKKSEMKNFHKLEQKWKSQADHDGIEWFLHWFDLPSATILDYLPKSSCIIWNDMFHPHRRLKEFYTNYETHFKRVPETFVDFVSTPKQLLQTDQQVTADIAAHKTIYIDTKIIGNHIVHSTLPFKEQPSCNGNPELLKKDLLEKEKQGYSITILCVNIGHAERLKELIDHEFPVVNIVVGYLENGFIDSENKIAFYSENNIFNRKYRQVQRKSFKHSVPINNFDSLTRNDFVVHIDHGIARFLGIERVKTEQVHQDCMVLEYQHKTRVFVPIEDFYKVQKYIGKDSLQPTISKLGTNRWEKQKARTRESIREMAEGLIKLYAKREYLEGIKFSKDTVWQKEFDDSFIYEITQDQITAIKDVKRDMESTKPMDRLVCGDVGFGKTEIAMRAAFKAVMSGFQVALLAPTTILAAQHYSTLTERMANFPVTIAVLSRFIRPKEQKDIIQKLREGSIDVVIGTHRILSKDIAFKNLGLLIVDEEQRFGVRSKEKLKEYRYKVDVLSMTATPIPRTMHMSLVGIRDLSIINTPPLNRLPIETHVYEAHDEIIKTAIENELDRGGQVYVVHNRIKNISLLQDSIELAVPHARVIIAHGQMNEKHLEIIMKEFVAGKYDVLLSTTIIENGLDIPNVNTIIVNRADSLGLSQLYQLRGRVGRSSEQAYAYFLTPSFKQINEASLKRLRTLEQYTDLGSGFQIAMRDLEIRGAGNILGTYQHGFIAVVGFELYCRLLKEEIDKVLGRESPIEQREIKIDIPIDAYIPADYISDSATRISLYQESSSCKDIDDITNTERSVIDRFGPLPETVQSLFILMRIKILGQKIGLSHISLNSDNVLCVSLHGNDDELTKNIKDLFATTKRDFEVIYGSPVVLKTSLISNTNIDKLNEIKSIFEKHHDLR